MYFLRLAFALLSWAGFAASLAIHAGTFFPWGVGADAGWPFALHVLIFIPFVAMVLSLAREGRREGLDTFLRSIPLAPRILVLAVFVYTGLNFAAMLQGTEGGTPQVQGDGYVLSSHGRVIRSLTREEYDEKNRVILRGFSGHWMLFFLVPACFFTFSRPRAARL